NQPVYKADLTITFTGTIELVEKRCPILGAAPVFVVRGETTQMGQSGSIEMTFFLNKAATERLRSIVGEIKECPFDLILEDLAANSERQSLSVKNLILDGTQELFRNVRIIALQD